MTLGNYAVMLTGTTLVTNIIVADSTYTMSGYDIVLYTADSPAFIGATYDKTTNTFSATAATTS